MLEYRHKGDKTMMIAEQEIGYKNTVEFLGYYFQEVNKSYMTDSNPILAEEMKSLQEGMNRILHPVRAYDILRNGFVITEQQCIILNYVSGVEKVLRQDMNVNIATTVLVHIMPSTFYFVTQHVTPKGNVYDFKYFDLKSQDIKIFKGISDADSLLLLFDQIDNTKQKIEMVKELKFQIDV